MSKGYVQEHEDEGERSTLRVCERTRYTLRGVIYFAMCFTLADFGAGSDSGSALPFGVRGRFIVLSL